MTYISFLHQLSQLNTQARRFFTQIIKEKQYNITSFELLILMKLHKNSDILKQKHQIQDPYLFKNIKFILTSLENKKIITINESKIGKEKISITPKGLDIINVFSQISIPNNIVSNLKELNLFVLIPQKNSIKI